MFVVDGMPIEGQQHEGLPLPQGTQPPIGRLPELLRRVQELERELESLRPAPPDAATEGTEAP